MKFAMRHRLLLLFVVSLAGGAARESRSRMEQLDSLLRGYAKALTWSDFEVAYTATQAAQVAPLPDAALLKEIKITAYEPATPLVEQDGKSMRRAAQAGWAGRGAGEGGVPADRPGTVPPAARASGGRRRQRA